MSHLVHRDAEDDEVQEGTHGIKRYEWLYQCHGRGGLFSGEGVPFRDAHGIVGRLVLYCVEKNTSIEKLTLEELQNISSKFEEDIYDAVSLKTCVEKRLTTGGPGTEAMQEMIETCRAYLEVE